MSSTTTPNHHQMVVNRRDAYRASVKGDWEIVHEFCTTQIQSCSSAVNASGDTILHLLILNHHTCTVLRLLHYLSSSTENYHHLLLAQNTDGNTALHEAVRIGSMEIVAALVENEESLVSIPNTLGETPLYWSAAYGKMNILCFLFEKSSEDNVLIRSDFSTILHAAVAAEFYGLAIKINELCPSLAWARDRQGITALHLMAKSPASFRSGTLYTYQNIGTSPFIPMDILAIIVYMCLPSYTYPTWDTMIRNMMEISGIKWLIRLCPWIRIVDDSKRKHACALELAKQLITLLSSHNYSSNMPEETFDIIKEPLLLASKHGIVEVFEKIIKEFPETMESVDEYDKNIMHLAVEHRREQVLQYLLKSKNFPIAKMIAMVDKDGNTPLHLAGKLGEEPPYVHGPSQQMPWEVLWFKNVKRLFPSHLLHLRNLSGQTAEEVYIVTHQNLQKRAEEWVKDMSNTLMVISVLIAAINFQAAFTIPGGNESDKDNLLKGYPIFLRRKYFIPYLFFLSISLFASLLSLGAALSAHLSIFNLEDYYYFLPLKLLVGGNAFFISALSSVWAYAIGIYLESSPTYDIFLMVVWHSGVWGANLLTLMMYVDIMYPIFRSVLRSLIHSLTYHGRGL